jgi:hypothetical protein
MLGNIYCCRLVIRYLLFALRKVYSNVHYTQTATVFVDTNHVSNIIFAKSITLHWII